MGLETMPHRARQHASTDTCSGTPDHHTMVGAAPARASAAPCGDSELPARELHPARVPSVIVTPSRLLSTNETVSATPARAATSALVARTSLAMNAPSSAAGGK